MNGRPTAPRQRTLDPEGVTGNSQGFQPLDAKPKGGRRMESQPTEPQPAADPTASPEPDHGIPAGPYSEPVGITEAAGEAEAVTHTPAVPTSTPGGSKELLNLALPLIVSQSFMTVQVFVDTVLLWMAVNERLFGTPRYGHDFPGLALESVHWLADRGIGMFGVEAVSPAPEGELNFQAHMACAERGITHMECLANLHRLVGVSVHQHQPGQGRNAADVAGIVLHIAPDQRDRLRRLIRLDIELGQLQTRVQPIGRAGENREQVVLARILERPFGLQKLSVALCGTPVHLVALRSLRRDDARVGLGQSVEIELRQQLVAHRPPPLRS